MAALQPSPTSAAVRPSNNRLPDVVRDHAIALVRERYADFGPTLTDLFATLREQVPPSLSAVPVAKSNGRIDACVRLARTWRNGRDVRDSYAIVASKVEQAAAAAVLVSPRRSWAQGTRRRLVNLVLGERSPALDIAFFGGLRNHGWIDGRNLIIEYRFAQSQDRLAALAAELVALNPDLLIAQATRMAWRYATPGDQLLRLSYRKNMTLHEAASYESIPGHPRWGVAPLSMAWEGKSLGEICRQLKDANLNGGRDLALLQEHIA